MIGADDFAACCRDLVYLEGLKSRYGFLPITNEAKRQRLLARWYRKRKQWTTLCALWWLSPLSWFNKSRREGNRLWIRLCNDFIALLEGDCRE